MWKHGLVGAVLVGSAWAQVTQRCERPPPPACRENFNTYRASVSFDGRYVRVRFSAASNLAADSNYIVDVFVRDRATASWSSPASVRAASKGSGTALNPRSRPTGGMSRSRASLSEPGFPGDTNGVADVFVRDRVAHDDRPRERGLARAYRGTARSSDLHGSDA
jgi:hypothetical protein